MSTVVISTHRTKRSTRFNTDIAVIVNAVVILVVAEYVVTNTINAVTVTDTDTITINSTINATTSIE